MAEPGNGVADRALRKSEHVRLALELPEPAQISTWDDVHLVHDALPDVDLAAVSLSTSLFGRPVALPLVFAGMTGGFDGATAINRTLARVAQRHGAVIGVGSQRAALADPRQRHTYAVVREQAPDTLVLANIGITQLIEQADAPGIGVDGVLAVVDMVRADALAIHLNLLEEIVQPEGQTRARGAAGALRDLVEASPVPVIAKETGCGISTRVAERLRALGIAAVDVGGSGGTSFAAIEAARARQRAEVRRARVGDTFIDWGIPTPVSVRMCAPVLPTIATGGLRSGLDAAKALALGATLAGLGRPLLRRAVQGEAALDDWVGAFADELRTATFLSGVAGVEELGGAEVVLMGSTREWLTAAACAR